jgi:hypothetical protein
MERSISIAIFLLLTCRRICQVFCSFFIQLDYIEHETKGVSVIGGTLHFSLFMNQTICIADCVVS